MCVCRCVGVCVGVWVCVCRCVGVCVCVGVWVCRCVGVCVYTAEISNYAFPTSQSKSVE